MLQIKLMIAELMSIYFYNGCNTFVLFIKSARDDIFDHSFFMRNFVKLLVYESKYLFKFWSSILENIMG